MSDFQASSTGVRLATAPYILWAEAVSYSYPSGTTSSDEPNAVTDVSLGVRRGEYVAILGRNGSGKSTLARMCNGLLLPSQGSVLVDGLDTANPAHRSQIRERVGMIFSDPDSQIIGTIVEDDVAWALAARGWARERIQRRVDTALSITGLLPMRTRAPYELSGGQRQRLAIASVLALEPACLIADEPTALLDPATRLEVTALLHTLCARRGLAILHVTHYAEEIAGADRVIVLDRGRVALDISPKELLSDLDRLRVLGISVPPLAAVGAALRRAGVPVPHDAITADRFVAALEPLP